MKKIALYLMNKRGLYTLRSLINEFGYNIIEFVVLSKDINVKNDYYLELNDLCQKFEIKVLCEDDSVPVFDGYCFAIGWRWLIKDTKKLIVLHDSILPRYRGFAPLVNMLINGENEIGVTALFATEDFDRGDIIQTEKITAKYPLKIKDAIDLLLPLYSRLVIYVVYKILENNEIIGIAQEENEASYSIWRDGEDYFIEWGDKALDISRKVDSLSYPYQGARSYLNNNIIIIDDVIVHQDVFVESRSQHIGKVIFIKKHHPIIVCGEGLLEIKKGRYLDGSSIIPLEKYRSRFR